VFVCRRDVVSRCLLVEWKMTKKQKSKDHERVKDKAVEQPVVVKERKGGMMMTSKKGQQRHVKRNGGYKRKPL
jgi:hypothetical protein